MMERRPDPVPGELEVFMPLQTAFGMVVAILSAISIARRLWKLIPRSE